AAQTSGTARRALTIRRPCCGRRRLLLLQTLLDPRLLQMPWDDHHDDARSSIAQQGGLQAPQAMSVEQMLPPVFLHHFRQQHRDQPVTLLALDLADQLQQGSGHLAERCLDAYELWRAQAGLSRRLLDISRPTLAQPTLLIACHGSSEVREVH